MVGMSRCGWWVGRRVGAGRGIGLVALAALIPTVASGQRVEGQSEPWIEGGPRSLVHQVWGTEDGLPLSHVNDVRASREGYLWLATYDGLVRFDGATFTVFNASNDPALPTSRFVSLHEDDEGALWAAAEFDHVIRLDRGGYDVFSLPAESRGGAIGALDFDPSGTAWVSTNRGLFSVGDTGLELETDLGGANLTPALHFRDGSVWVGSDGRSALRWNGGELEQFGRGDAPLSRLVTSFASTSDGTLLVGSGHGVLTFRDGTLTPLAAPLPTQPRIHALLPLGGDSILVVTDAGLLDLVGGELSVRDETVRAPGTTSVFLAGGASGDRWLAIGGRLFRNERLVFEGNLPIQGLAMDREGSLWVAAQGLHRFRQSSFEVVGDAEGGMSNVYPIFEDSRGRIWAGSLTRGLAIFENGRFRALSGEGTGLSQAIAEDAGGRVWVGRINYGGCILDGLECDPADRFLTGHTIKAIYRDRSDDIWVGTDRGVYRYADGVREHFSVEDGLPHDLVRVIRQTSDGAIWFGMNGGGIARYVDGSIEGLDEPQGFPSRLVRAIHEASPGVLWVGTEDAGLVRVALPDASLPVSAAEIVVVNRSSGLFDDGIHSIVDDGLGRLWMNTNRGIFWVLESELEEFAAGERSRVRSIAYTESDGLSNPEGNGGVQSAAIRSSDGRLWFAMQAGVAIVDPAEVEGAELPLPVLVEALSVEGGRTIPVTAAAAEPLILAPEERDFAVSFTALSFIGPENLRFQYRLSDFQTDWVDVADRRTAFFTNVPPGQYRFEARAARADGVWNEAAIPLQLEVRPFLVETVWFRSAVAAGVLLLGVGGVRTRERRRQTRERELTAMVSERTATIEAQSARLEEIDRAKSRFFTNISHEFRTPLTLTIGPLEDLVSGVHGTLEPRTSESVELSLRNSRRLLKLVNQLMDVAKLEAKAVELRASEGDIVSFVRTLLQAFEPHAERNGIQASLDAPDYPVPCFFDPDLLERVFMNVLSNAFKFTPKGGAIRVEVREPEEGWITTSIRDSGPGIAEEQIPRLFDRFYQGDQSREASQPGSGIGLSLAKELVTLHDGRLEVESDPGFGSVFTVWLRKGTAHLTDEQVRDDAPSGKERERVGVLVEEEVALLDTDVRQADSGEIGEPDISPEDEDHERPVVLVVEDNAEVAAYIRSHLEPGFVCVAAPNGEEALRQARETLPDAIISDVMMPQMDGLELLRALRADRDLVYVPVLLLTAKAGQEDKLEGLQAGAAAYLTKPFDIVELRTRVEGLIDRQRMLRERLRREALARPEPPDPETPGDRFLARLRETTRTNLGDENFDVRALARAMSESRSSLYRHLHELLGQTPSQYLREVRLEQAASMISAGAGSIQEIAYAVGFKSVSHFSRSFREQYGEPPSRYRSAD